MALNILIRLFIILIVSRFIKVEAVSAVKGSTVQLECPHQASAGKRITWSKIVNGVSIIYTDGTTINPSLAIKSRLAVTGDHTAGYYHLSISDVRKSDEGTYQCQLSGTAGSTTLQLSVITSIPTSLSIANVGLDNELNCTEGRNLMIRCSAVGGDPAPDVKLLISEYVVTVAKQSVQFILSSVNRSYDGQHVTCLAGYEDIFYYPLKESARIYLKLKPYPPIFSSDSANTEENKPLVISCTSTGSRPKASIYWLIGDGKTNITSNATQLPHSHDPTTDTYGVTSTLTFIVDRIYNGKPLICEASNEVTSEQGGGVETSKTLNVTYVPVITVSSPTYTQNDATRTVTCNPSGNPDSYIYHKWQHKSKYGEIIREFVGNQTLTLSDVPVLLRYQDGGEYRCTASNGIEDKYNKLEQTGYGLVTVNAPPVITVDNKDNTIQYGSLGQSTELKINVYSIPKYSNIRWYKGSILLGPKKYVTTEEPAMVKDMFHGVNVHVDGYRVTLTIIDLQEADFTTYTLRLYYGSQYVVHEVTLKSVEAHRASKTDVIIGATTGVLVALLIICIIIILVLKSKKGKVHTNRST